MSDQPKDYVDLTARETSSALPKKPYTAPLLCEYGDVNAITRATGTGGNNEGMGVKTVA